MASGQFSGRPEPGERPRGRGRPEIWAEGGQRPPFNIRAFGHAGLHLSREAVAGLHAWAARWGRQVAINVKNGAGRIPEAKLGRVARVVPSHLRVAAWIHNMATVLSHASATADSDIKRGNALVIEIEPYLWADSNAIPAKASAPTAEPDEVPDLAAAADTPPVVLTKPPQQDDTLAAIRNMLAEDAKAAKSGSGWFGRPKDKAYAYRPGQGIPPAPPGEFATGAIQVFGFLLGWLSSIAALPYGLGKAAWLHIKGIDLRQIGPED